MALLPENERAQFACLTRDLAFSGIRGDPRPTTVENGARWIATASLKIADALTAMLEFQEHIQRAPTLETR